MFDIVQRNIPIIMNEDNGQDFKESKYCYIWKRKFQIKLKEDEWKN